MLKTAAQISDEVLWKLAAAWQRRAAQVGVPQQQTDTATKTLKAQRPDPLAVKQRQMAARGQAAAKTTGGGLFGGLKNLWSKPLGKAGLIGGGLALGYGAYKAFGGGQTPQQQQYGGY